MDRIAIAAFSLHDTDVAGLEGLRRPEPGQEEAFQRELADALGASEIVVLATCNRLEIAFAREIGDLPDERDRACIAEFLSGEAEGDVSRAMHFHRGRAAVRHLFRIACSLDSLVVGEDQILGQVRDAYRQADGFGLTGSLLTPLFDRAFHVGKHVRSHSDLSRHPVSVVSLAVASLVERAGGRSLRVALIGAGKMAEMLGKAARAAELRVVAVANRSPERARALAETLGARTLSLAELAGGAEPVDAVLSATSAPGCVLDSAALLQLAARAPTSVPFFGIDVAMPRDLEPVDDPRVELVDIEALRERAERNRQRRAEAAAKAELFVQRKVDAFLRRDSDPLVVRTLADFREASQEMLERELRALHGGNLDSLDRETRAAVVLWAREAFGRLSHLGFVAIKGLARDLDELKA